MYTIKTLNNIAQPGLDQFNPERYTISDHYDTPDALIVRSFDMHDYQIPQSVQIVGRAGVGTNNIPIEKLSEQGIPVLNTPGANANAVKELVITGLLLACRHICRAWEYARHLEGNDETISATVEKNKNQFAGFELPGKTLGVIGLGNIGAKVANAAIALGMNVIGYDPTITVKHAWQLSSQVIQADLLEEVLSQSNFITLHIPLIDATRNLINQKKIALMQDGAVLLNFARDGIIDNNALLAAINSKKLQSFVTDFPTNILKDNPNVICLPHLGASTKEAEENCAMMIADQIQEFLELGHIKNSVNFPNIKMPTSKAFRIAIANRNIPNMVAQISTALSEKNINIVDMINKSKGDLAYTLVDTQTDINGDVIDHIKAINGVLNVRKIVI